jgi:hypothetical protein
MIISFCGSKSLSVGRRDQNLDQGSKICSKFKVLGMQRKWYHCVRLVLLIPAVYLLSQTESVWRSYRGLFAEPNRKKKEDADWAGRTATWQGRTVLTWHDGTSMAADVVTVLTWQILIG